MKPNSFTFVHVYSRVNTKNTRESSRLFTPPFRGRERVNGVNPDITVSINH